MKKPAFIARWIDSIQTEWRELKKSKPGQRFEERYCRKQKAERPLWRKALLPVVSLVMIALGLILLPAPGPGIPVVLIGFALLAEQFLWAARTLDHCEPPLRSAMRVVLGWWKNASTLLRRVVAVVTGLLALAAGALVFSLLN